MNLHVEKLGVPGSNPIDDGLQDTASPAGEGATMLTVPVNPPRLVNCTVDDCDVDAGMLSDRGFAVIVKSTRLTDIVTLWESEP